MSKFQIQRPPDDDLAGVRWARSAAAGGSAVKLDMRPQAFATKRFPVRLNHYELAVLQMAADLDHLSKQQQARRALREYCERKLKAAGVTLPK